jgi:CD63 antigen
VKIGELRSFLQNKHLDDATLVPTIVICVGIFIFILAFFGCCGAMQENRVVLETYSICLLLLVLMQILMACIISLFLEDINRDSVRSFTKMWRLRFMPDNQMMIDMVQENLECCGSNNMDDYSFNSIPLSCCKKDVEKCSKENAYTVGCKTHLRTAIDSSGVTISYLCIILAAFEVSFSYQFKRQLTVFIFTQLSAGIMGFILSSQIRKSQAKRRCCT